MYDGKTQFLIKNPINRYLINSPMLPAMKKNPDGSLTLYIQKDSPGTDKEANWLPAPEGPIYLVMRLYWPKKRRLRSCPQAKAPGTRPQSCKPPSLCRHSLHLPHPRNALISPASSRGPPFKPPTRP